MSRKLNSPFLFIFTFFALGILLELKASFSFGILCLLSFFFLFLSWLLIRKAVLSSLFLLVAFVFMGAIHVCSFEAFYSNDIARVAKFYRKKPIEVKGTIVSDVVSKNLFRGEKTTFKFFVEEVRAPWGWEDKRGHILVNLFCLKPVSRGMEIVLKGRLHRPYEFSESQNFSYKEYLEKKGIRYVLSVPKKARVQILSQTKGTDFLAALSSHRKKFQRILKDNFLVNEAGILQAILLGERSSIPKHISDLFKLTGTAHVLAISGLHVGIIASFFFLLLKLLPLPSRLQYIFCVVLLIYYVLLTGGRPSVIRSAIMATVFLYSFLFERETQGLNSLALSALIIVLINPMNLFDVGFQLSFAAVFSILFFSPRLIQGVSRLSVCFQYPVFAYLLKSMAVSFCAWMGVSGLIAYYFHIITPVTIMANLLVIPLIILLVTLGIQLLLVSFVFPTGVSFYASCLKVILNCMVGLVYLLEKTPGAYYKVQGISFLGISVYYVSLLIAWIILQKWVKKRLVET